VTQWLERFNRIGAMFSIRLIVILSFIVVVNSSLQFIGGDGICRGASIGKRMSIYYCNTKKQKKEVKTTFKTTQAGCEINITS